MKPKKGKQSTSKQVKQPAKKSTKKSTSKGTAKQNIRKRPATDDSDAESNDERPKRKKQNKNRNVEEIDDDGIDTTEPEEVVESDDEMGEDPEASDKVSKGDNYEKESITHERKGG
jgi:hypothetical protein